MDKSDGNSLLGVENKKRKIQQEANISEEHENYELQRKVPRINENESISYQLLMEETYKQKGTIETLERNIRDQNRIISDIQLELRLNKRDLDLSNKQNVEMKENLLKLEAKFDKEKTELANNLMNKFEEKFNKLVQNTGLGFNKQKDKNECFSEGIEELNDKVSEISDNMANIKDDGEQYVDGKFDAVTSEIKVIEDSLDEMDERIIDLTFGIEYKKYRGLLMKYKDLETERRICGEGKLLFDILSKPPLVDVTPRGFEALIKEMHPKSFVWKNQRGSTALHLATENGHHECVKLLLHNSSPKYREICSKDGWTPLHFAASKGHLKCVELLLKDSCPGYREMKTNKGATALYLATQNGHHECVKLLLHNSSPKYREICLNGSTPLHIATEKGHVKCVELLLKDSSPEYRGIKRNNGFTPLHVAAKRGHVKCVQLLLKDSSPEYREMESGCGGHTARDIAARRGHTVIVALLDG